jgi:hypothetical protein
MQITITATLTEEQVSILATVKWYQPTVTITEQKEVLTDEIEIIDGVFTPTWKKITSIQDIQTIVQNPQSRADFIAEQYNRLISTDAENEYIRYAKKQREDAELAEENAIREQVKASISSSIWN